MVINWKDVGKTIGAFLQKRSPEILTGLGIAAMGASVVFAVKATPKAVKVLEEDKKEKHTPVETVKITWKYYLPSAISFAAGASCVIFASHTNLRRNAALAAACSTTENMFREYKEAAKSVIGDKKENDIHDEMAKNVVEHSKKPEDIPKPDDPKESLFYDPYTSRYFYYDLDKMKRAILDTSFQLRSDEYVTYNEFYSRIDQELSRFGETEGWKAEDGPLEDRFSAVLTDQGQVYIMLDFNHAPKSLRFY